MKLRKRKNIINIFLILILLVSLATPSFSVLAETLPNTVSQEDNLETLISEGSEISGETQLDPIEEELQVDKSDGIEPEGDVTQGGTQENESTTLPQSTENPEDVVNSKSPTPNLEEKEDGKDLVDEDAAEIDDPLPTYYKSGGVIKPGPIIKPGSGMSMLMAGRIMALNGVQDGYTVPLDGLTLGKTASVHGGVDADGRQIFKLNLTATTESDIVNTQVPCDIVLVLDRSGSMSGSLGYTYTAITSRPNTDSTYYVKIDGDYQQISYYSGSGNNTVWRYGSSGNRRYVRWDANGNDTAGGRTNSDNPRPKPFYTRSSVTKMQALKDAANGFVDTVASQSPDSKIAVVSFAGNVTNHTSGLVNVSSNSIKIAINNLSANGATHSNKGLGIAKRIFQDDTNADRNRVVVMFTDGEPGNYGFEDNDGSRYAAAAINQAAVLKAAKGTAVTSNINFNSRQAGTDIDRPRVANDTNDSSNVTGANIGCGATVYTIGVFPSDVNSNLVNSYMTWVSSHKPYTSQSNYQTAPSPTNPNRTDGYYFTADSADGLEDIFQSIAEETGETIEDVIIKDYIDPRFDIVDGSGNIITGSTFTIDGVTGRIKEDAKGRYVEWTKAKIEPGTIADGKGFKGFVYVKPKADFIGGNNVPTNIPNSSAIYSGEDNIGSFPNPLVNVPFKLQVNNIEDTIFLGETIPRSQATAQGNMLVQSLNYDYPTGMLAYIWDKSFTNTTELDVDTAYNLTVTATPTDYISFTGGEDITGGYKMSTGEIYHDAVGTPVTTQVSDTGIYNIYVKNGTLEIVKNVEGTVDPDQTFIFEIKQYSDQAKTTLLKTFYETIRVESGNSSSRTVINLPKGFYEVEEKTDWSWQYDAVGERIKNDTLGMDGSGNRDINKTTAQTAFTNQSKSIGWLNSIKWVVNEFGGGGGH